MKSSSGSSGSNITLQSVVLNGKSGSSSNTLTTINVGPQRIKNVTKQDLHGYLFLLILKYSKLLDSIYFLNCKNEDAQNKNKAEPITYLKRLGNKLVVEEIGKYLVTPLFSNDRINILAKSNEDFLNESTYFYKSLSGAPPTSQTDQHFLDSSYTRGQLNFWNGKRIYDLVNMLSNKILESKSIPTVKDPDLSIDLKTLEKKTIKFLSSYYFNNFSPSDESAANSSKLEIDPAVKVQILAVRNKGVKAFNEDYFTVIQDYGEMMGIEEEKSIISKKALYIGLYDGHMGKQASEYSASHMHHYISQGIKEQKDLKEGIKNGFCKTDERFNYLAEKHSIKDGTTCIACFIQFYEYNTEENTSAIRGRLTVANCGDSKAVLCMKGGSTKIVNLTQDHRLDREDERKRVEASGATIMKIGVLRVNGELSITRSIGDRSERFFFFLLCSTCWGD